MVHDVRRDQLGESLSPLQREAAKKRRRRAVAAGRVVLEEPVPPLPDWRTAEEKEAHKRLIGTWWLCRTHGLRDTATHVGYVGYCAEGDCRERVLPVHGQVMDLDRIHERVEAAGWRTSSSMAPQRIVPRKRSRAPVEPQDEPEEPAVPEIAPALLEATEPPAIAPEAPPPAQAPVRTEGSDAAELEPFVVLVLTTKRRVQCFVCRTRLGALTPHVIVSDGLVWAHVCGDCAAQTDDPEMRRGGRRCIAAIERRSA